MLGVCLREIQHGLLLPALWRVDLDFAILLLGEQLLHHFLIFEIDRHVNDAGHVLLIEVDLQEQRGEEFGRIEFVLVFPEEIAPVHNHPIAQVEKIHGNERRLGVVAEDIGIVARGRGHFLALIHFFDRGQQIAQRAGFFEAHVVRSFLDAFAQFARERSMLAFEEQAHLPDRLRVSLGSRQAFDARPRAAVNVVLETGLRMIAPQIDLA